MKKWKSATWVKVTAFLLSVICFITFAGTGIATIYLMEQGYYTETKESIRDDWNQSNMDIYSMMVLDHLGDEDTKRNLENSNYKYAVIEAKSGEENIRDLDLSDTRRYVQTNIEQPLNRNDLNEKNAVANRYHINDQTEISYEMKLGGNTSIYEVSTYSSEESTEEILIKEYVYDVDEGIFYYQAEDNRAYPVTEVQIHAPNMEEELLFQYQYSLGKYYNASRFVLADSAYITFNMLDNTDEGCSWLDWDYVILDGYQKERNELQFKHTGDIPGKTSPDYEYVEEENLVISSDGMVEDLENNDKNYWVISYVQDPLVLSGDAKVILSGDLFEQADKVINLLFAVRYPIVWTMIIAFFGLCVSIVVLCNTAGHRKEQEGITAGGLQKVPFDLETGLIVVFEVIMLGGIGLGIQLNIIPMTVAMCIVFGILGYVAGLVYLLDFVVRIKVGKWWKNTIVYRFCAWCLRPVNKVRLLAKENLSLFMKVIVALVFINLFEFIGMVCFRYEFRILLFLWLVEKILIGWLLIFTVMQMDRLKNAAKGMASGNFQDKVDTAKMYWEFQKHGDNLNQIQEGLECAVNARMKSEHFKTELITNVSHDIKTPLTSIINYVDLLSKDGVTKEQQAEYLDVLTRQSNRLKKLIEDLMEASKASTGNQEVHLEALQLKIFISQIMGEFEDRLLNKNLELIVREPEEDMRILADGRHLWRVVDNLLVNICKYAMPGTRVYVDMSLHQKQKRAVLSFKNISQYPLNITEDELLERFIRGDASRNTEGSGLGLSIAQSLTELMHGTFQITVDGDLFKVEISFPLTDVVTGTEPDTKPEKKTGTGSNTKPEKKTGTKLDTKPEKKTDTKPDTKPEKKTGTEPDTKPEEKTGTEPDTKSEEKTGTEPDTKLEKKTDREQDTNS